MTRVMHLTYGDNTIPYSVTPDATRTSRVAIHVDPDGSVSVDTPIGYSDADIQKAVQKRARWITDHVSKAHRRFAHVRSREYVSGEQILYLGRRYMLKVVPVETSPGTVKLVGNRLMVETKTGNVADVKGRIQGWYRVKARNYFARRIDTLSKHLPWVADTPSFQMLEMKRQWGSCSPNGNIIINPHLIKAPRDAIDYVLIHELAHLKHHDHGRDFWTLIDTHAPEWRKAKHRLDGLVEVLLVS